MSAPISRPAEQPAHPSRLSWPPADGYGNGLDDAAWAPVLEISEQIVPDVLRALANAGASCTRLPRTRRVTGCVIRRRRPETYRLWVGASAHGRAEDVLVAVMPRLARDAARRADSAWR